jgi:hypothetical protein
MTRIDNWLKSIAEPLSTIQKLALDSSEALWSVSANTLSVKLLDVELPASKLLALFDQALIVIHEVDQYKGTPLAPTAMA